MTCQAPIATAARRLRWWLLVALLLAGTGLNVQAYPPAPFHLFYGMLHDEYGTPINIPGAEVIFETPTGVKIKTTVNPGIEIGANYRLEVPMDAGLLSKPYQPTALRPFVQFRVTVKIAGATYLPIEMSGNYSNLGQPGQRTRLNLTLGEDTNGDGLPDAWQRLINADLSKVQPNADAGNGLTYLQTYYAGTYAVDPENGFTLNIVGFSSGVPVLEFLAVTGRTYTVYGSSDLKTWKATSFRLVTEGTNAVVRANISSDSIKALRVEVAHQGAEAPPTFFRLMLQ